MRPLTGVTFSVLMAAAVAVTAMPAAAAKKQPPTPQPVLDASGTIIQPTTTIIPDGYGHNKIIVIPRRRSYLDTGTEVSVGDRSFRDYVLPPGGDPGRPYWFFGPDFQGTGRKPLPSAFDGTGLSPNNPF
jgi:hypothetical protein